MRISVKPFAMVTAALWGGCLFFVGLLHVIFPSYGTAVLSAMSSVYPGYHGAPTVGSLLIGTAWGLVDGAVGGCLLAWLYNLALQHEGQARHRTA
jgi:hypothetical protein